MIRVAPWLRRRAYARAFSRLLASGSRTPAAVPVALQRPGATGATLFDHIHDAEVSDA
ncbi:hypothetical protein ACQEPB_00375 [Novosphingobium fluoreni]|uniref:hypothetical protein n=1 Tax=Novosphingobium fluoreni TaxID=1391222 RepID=UPI003DA0C263